MTEGKKKNKHLNVLRMFSIASWWDKVGKADPGKQLSEHLPKKSLQKPRGELGQMATVQGDKIIRCGALTAWGNPPHSMFQDGKRWKKGMLQVEKGDKGKGLLQATDFSVNSFQVPITY